MHVPADQAVTVATEKPAFEVHVRHVQAFAAAAIEVLREQSVALQSVAESVRLRRKVDLQKSIRKVTPGSLRHHLACVGVTAAADDDLTVLEVTVHTRALQVRCRSSVT